MEEKAPARQVGYRNPDGSVTYISQPKKWGNPAGKTRSQVLLAISDSVDTQPLTQENIEDSLDQVSAILWREFQDNDHELYKSVNHLIHYLRKSNNQPSQVK
ncbi:hypothetical protein FY528_20245 [Hymenobacter lutimineralis]|uniref:Uncharacterized protein n=2 Tax=Hymenobacter TaxID=89966 RepID=A0A5D6UTB6_9BACT|nr:hypothetical protein [Hymenobacter lutimineralis]TYZ05882.1 hypothetical protein FY528_20245 [Hymenobacter lutimineralis]